MDDRLKGIVVPAVTPFDEADDLRLDWLEHNLERWSGTAVRGIMVLGTNGEFRSVDDDEARAVVATAAAARGDKTLIAGVGRESTHATVRFIDSIAEHADAVDYVSVLPPHYFAKQMTGAALRAHYTEVADRSPIPVLLYVAPAYANGVVVAPDVVAELADHPNIAGIKDTSTDKLTAYMLAAGGRDDFAVLAGTMNTIMTGLHFGGPGGVVSAANFVPDDCAEVVALAVAGRTAEALQRYAELHRLIAATGGRKGVASLKAAMNELGYRAGVPRRPVPPLPAPDRQELRAALAAAGRLQSA